MNDADQRAEKPTPLRPWRRLARRTVYQRTPWLSVHLDHVRLPDGREIPDYHWLESPPYVLVVAETRANELLIFEQYRYGVQGTCLCLPGGMIDPGETPEIAARRELLEETGYVADHWHYRQPMVTNANSGGATGHIFHATGAYWQQPAASGDMEDMNLQLLGKDQVMSAIGNGRFLVASNLAAIASVLLR